MKTNYLLALLALIGGLAAAFTSHSEKNALYPTWDFDKDRFNGERVEYISAKHLAHLLYQKDQGFVLLDLRAEQDYDQYHLPSALSYEKENRDRDWQKSTYVLYGLEADADLKQLKSDLPGKVYVLKGGMEAWQSLVLFPDFKVFKVRNREALEQILRRSRYFGGSPQNTQLLNIEVRQGRYREGC